MKFGYYKAGRFAPEKDEETRAMLLEHVTQEGFLFFDKKGASKEQGQYQFLMTILGQGDLLYLDRLDSLGIGLHQILQQWRYITEVLGADIIVLDCEELLDSRQMRQISTISQQEYFLFLLNYLSEMQRSRNQNTQKNNDEISPVKNGLPRLQINDKLFSELLIQWEEDTLTTQEVCQILGCTRSTWYNYVRDHQHNRTPKNSKKV